MYLVNVLSRSCSLSKYPLAGYALFWQANATFVDCTPSSSSLELEQQASCCQRDCHSCSFPSSVSDSSSVRFRSPIRKIDLGCIRDLKSANVIIGNDLSVRVIDFGKSETSDAPRRSSVCLCHGKLVNDYIATSLVLVDRACRISRGIGTTQWSAPEVFANDSNYSEAADVYSFGMTSTEVC